MIDVLLHVANVLYLVSYLVRDILWLRFVTIIAIVTLMPYYFANGLMLPVIWSVVFLLINVYQIYILLLQRRPVQLDARQQRLYQRVFRTLTPRDFLGLVGAGTWHEVAPGNELLRQGEVLDQLHVIDEGEVEVTCDDRCLATLGAGSFVGEMSYVTGEPTSAAVVARAPTQVLSWRRESLDEFLSAHPDARAALQMILGTDMAAKLRAA